MLALNNIILEDLEDIYRRDINWEKLRNKTVFITGVNGLIASYFVYFLMYLNDEYCYNIKIVGLARNEEKVRKRYGSFLDRKDFKVIYQDVINKIQFEGEVDFIIHAASPTGPKQFMSEPVDTILANAMGANNLLEFAQEKGVEAFLLLSTREIYGSGSKDFVKEEDYGAVNPTLVRSCYPESKRLSETLCAAYRQQYHMNCKVARIDHAYGPGMLLRDGRVVGDFLGNILDNKDIILNSDGSGMLALTYIADVLAGIMMTILNFEGFVYNIANSERTVSVKELAETLIKLFPQKNLQMQFEILEDSAKAGYLGNKLGFLDSEKAVNEGWRPKISLAEGMKRTIQFFESTK
ncbi:MAG: NAD-dependent epimerase/dehydratase family protein [Lachnospiraceae bacterium]|nr:NAD-dependent epimerase/dehydratase family protein [Lachnospiraceae bacterium]